jgi:hypothetical protein
MTFHEKERIEKDVASLLDKIGSLAPASSWVARGLSEPVLCESHTYWWTYLTSIIQFFIFRWWYVAKRFQQLFTIKPRYPIQRCIFNCIEVFPLALFIDHLSFKKPDHTFCQCVIIRITDTAYGRPDSFFGKSISVANREIERYWLPRSLWWNQRPRSQEPRIYT